MSSFEPTPGDPPVTDPDPAPRDSGSRMRRQMVTILLFIAAWTFVYNLSIKGQNPLRAFFHLLDTISDDFVVGSLMTIGLGLLIVAVFSITKLYGQIVAQVSSFRLLELLVFEDLKQGRFRDFFGKLMRFRDLPPTEQVCPHRVSFILLSFCFIYLMSWIYVILFSEALFFASWSAGVNLPINEHNVLMMPTLALGIPFSARVMAYFRYPYAQDFADLMPAATFVLLLVTSLGFLFESPDQQFYLQRVFDSSELAQQLLINGVFLAFIPVFSEAIFWLIEIHRDG